MSEETTDVLVVGGGPGGTPAAMALARAGKRVVLVERGPGLGGTCLFEGCIPSKIFRESARRLRELREADAFGLRMVNPEVQVDWAAIQARKRAILERRSRAALDRARRIPTLSVVFGTAELLSPRSARIKPHTGEVREVGFEQAILAPGSIPVRPPIPGVDLPGVLDSEGILDDERIPERLVVIGGGPIGVELGQVFRTLGSEVHILEIADHILGPVDRELAERLEARMRADGIGITTGCKVGAIEARTPGLQVQAQAAGGEALTLSADTVLLVTGRHPRVEGLGLERTAVRHGPHGIEVDAELQTAEPGIYAVGDAIGHPMFAHWATAQGLALARRLLGMPAAFPRPETNSAVIFSEPELGMAGLTEEEARARGLDVDVARYDYAVDARAQIAARDAGLLKIVYERSRRRVVGVHALVEGAGELMGEAALLVAHGLPVEAVAAAIHPHPTLTESFGQAARNALMTPPGH